MPVWRSTLLSHFMGVLVVNLIAQTGLCYVEAGGYTIVYQQHEVPGLINPIAEEYLSLMPDLPRDRSWVKGHSAYLFSPTNTTSLYEIALILVYTTSPGVGEFSNREDGLKEAYIILARRSGENLSWNIQQRINNNQTFAEIPYISYNSYPDFSETNLTLLTCETIYTYGEARPAHFTPAWGDCYAYPRLPERRLEGQGGTWFRLLPLTSANSLDIVIQLEHEYLVVCKWDEEQLRMVFNALMRARDPGIILPSKETLPWERYVQSICIDLNKDGQYELLVANDAYQDGFPSGYYLPFFTCYRWENDRYIEDNALFYGSEYAWPLLENYLNNYRSLVERMIEMQKYPSGGYSPAVYYPYFYEFYLGLIYYYRDDWQRAGFFLRRALDGAPDESCVIYIRGLLENIEDEIDRLN